MSEDSQIGNFMGIESKKALDKITVPFFNYLNYLDIYWGADGT